LLRETTVLENGAFVALGLLVIWVALLIPLARGTLKAIPLGAASMFLALMIPFFWLGPEITELTILKVGSFKTNAEQATKYFEEIKSIRAKIEAEDHAINAAVESLDKEIAAARAETKQIRERMADRKVTDDQQARIVPKLLQFASQEYGGAIASGIADGRILWESLYRTLITAGWQLVPPSSMGFGDPPAAVPISPSPGVVIYLSPAHQSDAGATAKALASALISEGITTNIIIGDFGDMTRRQNMIEIVIGPKPAN
jgi:hypothetical protein